MTQASEKTPLFDEFICQSLIEHTSDLFVVIDQDGMIEKINSAVYSLLGYKQEEMRGQPFASLIPMWQQAVCSNLIQSHDKSEQTIEMDMIGKCGQTVSMLMTFTKVLVDHRQQIVGVGKNITSLKERENMLRQLAFYDKTTSLPNQIHFLEKMESFIQKKQPFAVCRMGIDKFKVINDTFGKSVGDALIFKLSKRLESLIPKRYELSRFGGDEFIFTLPANESFDQVNYLLQEIKQPMMVNHQDFYMTASIGISTFPLHGKDRDTLIKHAGLAMRRAKQLGYDRVEMFSKEINEEAVQKIKLESDLRKAIDKSEFVLFYQPLIDLKNEKVIGAEALIRWNHPKHGLISPLTFIPIAEETGLIKDIGRWVLHTACLQIKKWYDNGLTDFTISVNVSAKQLQHRSFLAMVKAELDETGICPDYLHLELTESMLLYDVQYTVMMIEEIQNLGIKVSIDDFGTGYSSLSYLKNFPVNTIKIDRSFIAKLQEEDESKAIVQAIVTMGKGIGATVLAEGLETPEQMELLRELGCMQAQGYYISRPIEANQFEHAFLN